MILIAGGAGYIGSHANKILNKRGYETVVYDNLSRGHREFAKWGHFVLGDLADKDQLRLCFKTYPIEAVMHYCAFCYVGESVDHPAEYYRNNIVNTINLLDVMVEYRVKYFIFSSTCSTYGNPLQIPMTEDHPQQPINPYGKSKLMVEQILKDYDEAYGIRHVCLRYFNAAGADPEGEIGEWHEPEPHLIPLSLQAAAGDRNHVKIYGTDYDTPDGTCIRDYIHINDLAAGHLLALEYLQKGAPSDAFNLCNGKGFSVKEVIHAAERATGKSIKVVEAERRPGDPPILVGSSDKARKILNWQADYPSLDEIIKTSWFWFMKQNGEKMLSKDIRVEAFWDEEAHVWVASSNDVPGLITEADTMEQLMQKLKIVIPELLQANGLLNEPGTIDIPIHLLGKWQEVIKTHTRNG